MLILYAQKVAYATSKSDTLAKLDGTYKQPETAANKALGTTAQQSVFAGPPGTSTSNAPAAQLPNKPPPGLAPPPAAAAQAASPSDAATPGSQGVKRTREESDDEDEAPMDVDDDAMEESDDE